MVVICLGKNLLLKSVLGHCEGPFNNYVDRFLPFRTLPLRGQFFYLEHGQKQTFFDPQPHSVHVVIEWPLTTICTPKISGLPLGLLRGNVDIQQAYLSVRALLLGLP